MGRQLARVSSTRYGETIWSELYPGNRHTVRCLKPAVLAVESSLELSDKRRRRTVWRIDGGGGSDENILWLLNRGYHVMVKGKSNRRIPNLLAQVKRWDAFGDAWVAEVSPPPKWQGRGRFFVKKRPFKDAFAYSYYVSSLQLPSKKLFMKAYDARGGAEVEQFRNDKSGLFLASRRKRSFPAQRSLIFLTDMAHNLLAHFQLHALVDSRFASFGAKRIIRDLFHIPGYLTFDQGKLLSITLANSNANSKHLIICLEKYLFGD